MMGDAMNAARNFLNDFVNGLVSNNGEEALPIGIAGSYPVEMEDISLEAIDASLYYLEQRKCPHQFKSFLSRRVASSLCTLAAESEECPFPTSEVLHMAALDSLNKLCHHLLSHPELIDTSAFDNPLPFFSSEFAIKNKRRRMEDRHVVIHDLNAFFDLDNYPKCSYYAVFDGHAGIDTASFSSSHLHANIVRHPLFMSDTKKAIVDAYILTDQQFCSRTQNEEVKSGCTAVNALIMNGNLYIAWVGDSQAYLFKQGNPVEVMTPHKPDRQDERERIENLGGFVCHVGTWRVNGTLAVSRAIGDQEFKPYINSEPDINVIPLDGTEDFLILACDGLWDCMTAEDASASLYQSLCQPDNMSNIAEELVYKSKHEGSEDNITAIVIFLRNLDDIRSSIDTNQLILTDENVQHPVPQRPKNFDDFLGSYPHCATQKNLIPKLPPEATVLSELPTPPIDDIILNEQFQQIHLSEKLSEVELHSEVINDKDSSPTIADLASKTLDAADSGIQSPVVMRDEASTPVDSNDALEVAAGLVSDIIENAVAQVKQESPTVEVVSVDPSCAKSVDNQDVGTNNAQDYPFIIEADTVLPDALPFPDSNKSLNASSMPSVSNLISLGNSEQLKVNPEVTDINIEALTNLLDISNNALENLCADKNETNLLLSCDPQGVMENSIVQSTVSLVSVTHGNDESAHPTLVSIDDHGNVTEAVEFQVESEKNALQRCDEKLVSSSILSESGHGQVPIPEALPQSEDVKEIPEKFPNLIETSENELLNVQTSSAAVSVQNAAEPLTEKVSNALDSSCSQVLPTSESLDQEPVSEDSQPVAINLDLKAVPASVPEAEGVIEDNDSDSEKDGGWSYVKASNAQDSQPAPKMKATTTKNKFSTDKGKPATMVRNKAKPTTPVASTPSEIGRPKMPIGHARGTISLQSSKPKAPSKAPTSDQRPPIAKTTVSKTLATKASAPAKTNTTERVLVKSAPSKPAPAKLLASKPVVTKSAPVKTSAATTTARPALSKATGTSKISATSSNTVSTLQRQREQNLVSKQNGTTLRKPLPAQPTSRLTSVAKITTSTGLVKTRRPISSTVPNHNVKDVKNTVNKLAQVSASNTITKAPLSGGTKNEKVPIAVPKTKSVTQSKSGIVNSNLRKTVMTTHVKAENMANKPGREARPMSGNLRKPASSEKSNKNRGLALQKKEKTEANNAEMLAEKTEPMPNVDIVTNDQLPYSNPEAPIEAVAIDIP